jgi:restriction system protein
MLPNFQTIMLPLLESLKEGKELAVTQLHDALASYFELTDEELNERLPDSDQTVFYQRINEAKTHLLRAGLLSTTNQDSLAITSLGKQVLHRRLNSIDTNYLKRFPGYTRG